jgi:hypothetical protein
MRMCEALLVVLARLLVLYERLLMKIEIVLDNASRESRRLLTNWKALIGKHQYPI